MHENSYFAKALDGRLPRAPVTDLLGWQFIDFDSEAMVLRAEMEGRPEFLNPAGFIHGGMLAAMLDEIVAPTVAATLEPDQIALTLEIKVSFVAPAAAGRIIGRGRIVSRGRSICFVEAELRNDGGTLLAIATATSKVASAMLTKPAIR